MLDQLFSENAIFFAIPAVLGTALFLLRMGMLLMGGLDVDMGDAGDVDFDLDLGNGADGGLDANSEPIDHGGTNTDSAFQLISLQSIAAFLMGGGWGGISAYLGLGMEMKWSVLVALGMGLAMLYLFAWLMKMLYDMQSSGNINPSMILGHEAQVDVEVPSSRGGQGTVKVIVSERMRRYHAITEGPTLARGSSVKIIKVNPDNTVSVTRS